MSILKPNMPVALCCDHAGFDTKQAVIEYFKQEGIEYKDFGTYSPESIDYAAIAYRTCNSVTNGACEKAVLCCGTGIGISMAANKVKGIRAACCSDYFSAKFTRLHNDANVLCLGARVVGEGLAWELAECFVTTPFEGGKHARRVGLIHDIENKQ